MPAFPVVVPMSGVLGFLMLVSKGKRKRYLIVMQVVKSCSETNGVFSASTKANLSIYLHVCIVLFT